MDSSEQPIEGRGLVLLGKVLGRVLADRGLVEGAERARLLSEWPDVVGEHMARVSRPRLSQGPELVIEVSSSPWLNELSLRRGELLEKINRHLGRHKVRKLRFRLMERSPSSGKEAEGIAHREEKRQPAEG